MAICPIFKDDAFHDGSGGGEVAKNIGLTDMLEHDVVMVDDDVDDGAK